MHVYSSCERRLCWASAVLVPTPTTTPWHPTVLATTCDPPCSVTRICSLRHVPGPHTQTDKQTNSPTAVWPIDPISFHTHNMWVGGVFPLSSLLTAWCIEACVLARALTMVVTAGSLNHWALNTPPSSWSRFRDLFRRRRAQKSGKWNTLIN